MNIYFFRYGTHDSNQTIQAYHLPLLTTLEGDRKRLDCREERRRFQSLVVCAMAGGSDTAVIHG